MLCMLVQGWLILSEALQMSEHAREVLPNLHFLWVETLESLSRPQGAVALAAVYGLGKGGSVLGQR